MSYVIFDTETTDLNGEAIQLSYMVVNKDFSIQEFKSFYVDVNCEISKGAYDVHGVDKAMLESLSGGKYIEDYYDDIKRVFSKDNIAIGYNVDFDIKIMSRSLLVSGLLFPMYKIYPKLDYVPEGKGYSAYDMLATCKRANNNAYRGNKLHESVERFVKPKVNDINAAYDRICSEFGIRRSKIGFHDASYDVFCTYLLMICLVDKL